MGGGHEQRPTSPGTGSSSPAAGPASGSPWRGRRSQRGASVAVLDLEPTGLPSTVDGVRGDVADDASTQEAVRRAVAGLGGLDVLVNNAGIGAVGTVEEGPIEEWRRVFEVNVLGIVRTSRAALPHLRRSPQRRDRQHLLDRGHRRPAPPRALQREQGRGAGAHPRDGRRPRRRGDPGELRQPGHGRHPVGRPAAGAGRGPGGRAAGAGARASPPAGWSAPTRWPPRSSTWRRRRRVPRPAWRCPSTGGWPVCGSRRPARALARRTRSGPG